MASREIRWEQIACPICEGAKFTRLFEVKGEPFVRCDGCGLMLINPRPVYEQVMDTYDAGYSRGYAQKLEKKLRRVRRWVAAVKCRYETGGRWLDVGCSIGAVVVAAKEAGYEAYGIDVEPWGLNYAREQLGLRHLDQGLLEEKDYPMAYFDVISLYEVIEHVPDLNGLVAELARILRPGGVLDIRTPDMGHWRVPTPIETWDAIKPSEHLYYFNASTLGRLLARHGLRIVRKRFNLKPGLKVYAQHSAAQNLIGRS